MDIDDVIESAIGGLAKTFDGWCGVAETMPDDDREMFLRRLHEWAWGTWEHSGKMSER